MTVPRSTVAVQLSGRCNLACTYCYQDHRHVPARMGWSDLRAALDAALAWNAERLRVDFTGGEPLLEPGLLRRAIAHVEATRPRATRVEYTVTTNGTLIGPELLGFLAQVGVAIHLSHDGLPAAQDRRGRGTFAALDSLLDAVREGYPDSFRSLKVGMTLVAASIPTLADSVRYFVAKGVPKISVSPCSSWDPDWCADAGHELERQVADVVLLAEAHWRSTQTVPVTFLAGAPLGSADAPPAEFLCGAPSGTGMCVDAGGRAWACPFFASSLHDLPPLAREASRVLDLGDARAPSLARKLLMLPEEARKLRAFTGKRAKHSSFGKCDDCRFVADCHVCPASICHIPGNLDPDLVPDFVCAFNLATLSARQRFHEVTGGEPSAAWYREMSQALHALREVIASSLPGVARAASDGAGQASAAGGTPGALDGSRKEISP